ncbi:hypothetical protein Acsp03_02200 [Actinomadura sp. NBRC 104412]|uniref:SAM-dependent methyltransferase n=1 Tax=Actinomadura sp. NBRC 104412 TaxID=3032203 RepID=UPI0024A2A2C8|nr:SAM-dependent methyltransferase [Actinomadura sp. NBRC 104412]GLZ02753.1 hypothetical protein Acsp03_02200 [Actinomadura sp. NBRC 104412]
MVGPEEAPKRIDTSTPNHARVYDYFLGGKTNYEADRLAAGRIARSAPDTPVLARELRQFLVRVVRTLSEAGIRQFIDIGTGIPTSPSVHEVARTVDPDARVVYVDNDPVVVVHADALLATDAGVAAVEGDLRKPEQILDDPAVRRLIDFGEPVGILCIAVFHLVADHEDPAGIVAAYRERMAPGSHLALVQFSADSDPEGIAAFNEIYADSPVKVTFRERERIRDLFDGFELLPPGLVGIEEWRPERDHPRTRLKIAGGVGVKP